MTASPWQPFRQPLDPRWTGSFASPDHSGFALSHGVFIFLGQKKPAYEHRVHETGFAAALLALAVPQYSVFFKSS